VILTVPHEDVVAGGPARLRALMKPGGLLFDMKAAFGPGDSELRL
jgi:UDP-N-acetyl-D-glucosamine/UDP-N-acetyl-D-galactosamine dehydrogenase